MEVGVGGMAGVPSTEEVDVLTALVAAGPPAGELNGALVRLWTNNITPNKDSVLADLTAATFDGYADSAAVVWGAPFIDKDGNGVVQGGTKQFECTGTTTVELVYGAVLMDGGKTKILQFQKFANPINVNAVGVAVVYTPVYSFTEFDNAA